MSVTAAKALAETAQPAPLGIAAGLAGVLVVVAFRRGGATTQSFALVPLLVALAWIVVLDARYRVIPNVITLPALAYALLRSAVLGTPPIGTALLGVLVAGGGLLGVAMLSRGGIGGGDVKLMGLLGAAAGWKSALIALALSQVGGALILIWLGFIHRRLVRVPVPIGSLIALAGAWLLA